MADLARDFFQRDLDDAEWRALGEQLARDGAVADRFLEQAAGYYAQLGIPEPGVAGHGLGPWGGLALGLALGAAAGGGLVWWLRAPAAPLPAPQARPTPAPLSRPTLAPPPVGAPARQASLGFPGLTTVVELTRQGLVTARVITAGGEEQRLLYAGMLEPGRWSFGWDGRNEAGRWVPAGTYSIEVQEGSRVLRKQVVLNETMKGDGP